MKVLNDWKSVKQKPPMNSDILVLLKDGSICRCKYIFAQQVARRDHYGYLSGSSYHAIGDPIDIFTPHGHELDPTCDKINRDILYWTEIPRLPEIEQ